MTPEFSIDVDELTAAANALEAAGSGEIVDATLEDLARKVGDVVRDSIRKSAGRHGLASSVVVHTSGRGAGIRVLVAAEGRLVHLIVGGTRPHEIRAIGDHALAIGSGPTPFVHSVRHPGTRPDPFVARGVELAAPAIASIMQSAAGDLAGALADLTEGQR